MDTPGDNPIGFGREFKPLFGESSLLEDNYFPNLFCGEDFGNRFGSQIPMSVLPLPIYDPSTPPPLTSPTRFSIRKRNLCSTLEFVKLNPPPLASPLNEKYVGHSERVDLGDEDTLEEEEEEEEVEEEEEEVQVYEEDECSEQELTCDIGVLLRPSRRKDTGYVSLRKTVPPTMCCRPYKYILRLVVPYDREGEDLTKDSFDLYLEECPSPYTDETIPKPPKKKKKKKIPMKMAMKANNKKKKKKKMMLKKKTGRFPINFQKNNEAVKMEFLRDLSDKKGMIYDFNIQFFRSTFLNSGTQYRLIICLRSSGGKDVIINDEDEDDDDDGTTTVPKNMILRTKKFSLVARKVKKLDDKFWDMYPANFSNVTGFKRKRGGKRASSKSSKNLSINTTRKRNAKRRKF